MVKSKSLRWLHTLVLKRFSNQDFFAVLVRVSLDLNDRRGCGGCRDATRRLEAHQLMAARLSRSKNAIQEEKSQESDATDLLDLLLGGNDFEDDEESEPPSMISLE